MRFEINIAETLQHSFQNYHAKGLDYLCTKRSAGLTEKLYFIGDDLADQRIVVPHDHRYDFHSLTLAGICDNLAFEEDPDGEQVNRFAYDTPLNGGSGFSRDGTAKLNLTMRKSYTRNYAFKLPAEAIHTLICSPRTILLQHQLRDTVTTPTRAYSPLGEIPSTDDLYERMTEDRLRQLIGQLEAARPDVKVITS